MKKNTIESLQKAQGLVEFALALPVLLLILFGIIGFGHLFFVYSSTVAASREAARFGAAVGVTEDNIPRFQDCDAIRASAVRIGTFAGVANTVASVAIQYDEGEEGTEYGSCPVGGTSGEDVPLGDRIVVTVTVPYRSIVPLVNIPSFNLTATTRRTIVRSLAVGEAPTAEPLCPTVDMVLTTDSNPSLVGQQIGLTITMEASDGSAPTTNDGLTINYYDRVGNLESSVTADAAAEVTLTRADPYWYATHESADDIGNDNDVYMIEVIYDPGDDCYEPARITAEQYVLPAPTQLDLTLNPEPDVVLGNETYIQGTTVSVGANLMAVSPAARQGNSWLNEDVSVTAGSAACQAPLSAAGAGGCTLVINTLGSTTFTASFAGDDADGDGILDYEPSEDTWGPIQVIEGSTPTFVIPDPTATPVTPTPDSNCPYFSNFEFDGSGGQIRFRVNNPAAYAQVLYTLSVTWPSDPIAAITQVRFDDRYTENSCNHTPAGHRPDCIYNSSTGDNPPSFSISGFATGQVNARNWLDMVIVFSSTINNVPGAYHIELGFNTGCSFDLMYEQ